MSRRKQAKPRSVKGKYFCNEEKGEKMDCSMTNKISWLNLAGTVKFKDLISSVCVVLFVWALPPALWVVRSSKAV